MIKLTFHAQRQIENRQHGVILDRQTGRLIKQVTNLVTPSEVLDAVSAHESEIRASNDWEVRVVVKTFEAIITTPDGKPADQWSNGDCLVACVDPATLRIKTVMLQRSSQIRRKVDAKYLY